MVDHAKEESKSTRAETAMTAPVRDVPWQLPPCLEGILRHGVCPSGVDVREVIKLLRVLMFCFAFSKQDIEQHVSDFLSRARVSVDDEAAEERLAQDDEQGAGSQMYDIITDAIGNPAGRTYSGCPFRGTENATLEELQAHHCQQGFCFLWRGSYVIPDSEGFEIYEGGIRQRVHPKNGEPYARRLSDFSAWIESEVVLVDRPSLSDEEVDADATAPVEYLLRGIRDGLPLPPLRVRTSEFEGMRWQQRWGASLRILPVITGAKQWIATVIRTHSRGRTGRTCTYPRLGWVRHCGRYIYCHTRGALGTSDRIRVQVPDALARYRLPAEAGDPRKAFFAALKLLDAGKAQVVWSGICAVMRAPLSSLIFADVMLHYVGASQAGKSTWIALLVSFFGDFGGDFGRNRMPCQWDDSFPDLRDRLDAAGDVLVPIDDLHPHAAAEARKRSAENHSKISRMVGNDRAASVMQKGSDGSWQSGRKKKPRGMIISSGERTGSVESSVGRNMYVEFEDDATDEAKVDVLRSNVAALQQAMVWYLKCIAADLNKNANALERDLLEIWRWARDVFRHRGLTGRQAEAPAHLFIGASLFLDYAHVHGFISEDAKISLLDNCLDTLEKCSAYHTTKLHEQRPEVLFLENLEAVMRSGGGCLLDVNDLNDGYPRGDGTVLGYYDQDVVYLHGQVAYHKVKRFAGEFPLSYKDFLSHLLKKGLSIPWAARGVMHPTHDKEIVVQRSRHTRDGGMKYVPEKVHAKFLVLPRTLVAEHIPAFRDLETTDLRVKWKEIKERTKKKGAERGDEDQKQGSIDMN